MDDIKIIKKRQNNFINTRPHVLEQEEIDEILKCFGTVKINRNYNLLIIYFLFYY